MLDRAPDPQGLASWRAALAGGMSRGELIVAFSESAEFRVRSREEVYVTQVYAGMLRRTADPQGYASWRAVLEAGGSGISLIQGFLDSPEYRRRFLP